MKCSEKESDSIDNTKIGQEELQHILCKDDNQVIKRSDCRVV